MTTPLPCPRCDRDVKVTYDGVGYVVVCNNCYGWTPDEGHESEIVSDLSRIIVIREWNEAVQQYDSWLCSGCGSDLPEADLILCAGCR